MSNVVQLSTGPRCRVLIAHERNLVRHALRTLIETEDVVVVEASDGDDALNELGRSRFDLLVIQLDLPEHDGTEVVLMHRLLLDQLQPGEPPDVILTLPREIRDNRAVTDRLRSLGITEFIDDEPRGDVAGLVEMILRARLIRRSELGKPAAA